jgi:hypothetical protein
MATATKDTSAPAAKEPTNPPKPKSGEPEVEPIDYKLTNSDVVIRTKDGVHIHNDPNNADRVQYEAWGMAGGVAMPADPPPTPPPIQPEQPEPKHQSPEAAHVTMTTTRTRER